MLCSLLNDLQLHMRTLDNARQFCAWPNFIRQETELSTSLNKVAKHSRHFNQHACRALYSENSRAFGQCFSKGPIYLIFNTNPLLRKFLFIHIILFSSKAIEQLLEFSYSVPMISWHITKGLHLLKFMRHFVSTPNFGMLLTAVPVTISTERCRLGRLLLGVSFRQALSVFVLFTSLRAYSYCTTIYWLC